MADRARSPVPGEDDGPVAWIVPEIASLGVLVLAALLAAGGLATGIVSVLGSQQDALTGTQLTGQALENGASWGGALLAVALVGVLGVAWWQAGTYAAPGDPDLEAATRLWRAWQLRRFALIGLLLTAAGAVAGFVGVLITTLNVPLGVPPINWARDILEGASTLATVLVAAVGIWVGGQVSELVSIPDDVEEPDR